MKAINSGSGIGAGQVPGVTGTVGDRPSTPQQGTPQQAVTGYRKVLRYNIQVKVGGGWGRIQGEYSIAIPRSVLDYMEQAILHLTSGLEAPPGGGYRVVFNGAEIGYKKPVDVTNNVSTINTISIEIWAMWLAWWIGDTVVHGYLDITCLFPSTETMNNVVNEARETVDAGNKSQPGSGGASLNVMDVLMQVVYIVPFIVILIFVIYLLRAWRGGD